MITGLPLQVLQAMAKRTRNRGAEPLSKDLGIGRNRIQEAITYLRNIGAIETITVKFANGSPVKSINITDLGDELLGHTVGAYSGAYIQQPKQNSYIPNIAYSYISKPNSEQGSREAHMSEYYYDEDERLEAQRKFREKQHAEKVGAHEDRRQQRMVKRSQSNAVSWSSTDSAFEFAEQMHSLWHIKPWQVTRSRFRYALDAKRKEFNTDGSIELEMMKLFFSQIKHETKLVDPEMVWKRFIVQFHNLLTEVQRSKVTTEEIEVIKEKAKRSLEWMDNV